MTRRRIVHLESGQLYAGRIMAVCWVSARHEWTIRRHDPEPEEKKLRAAERTVVISPDYTQTTCQRCRDSGTWRRVSLVGSF